MARKQPQKSKSTHPASTPKPKRSEEGRKQQPATSQNPQTKPTTGERLINYSQKTLQQSSRAATAAEELLSLFNQEQGKSQDDPIQLLQDTLAQLVELQLNNAERLTRIEKYLSQFSLRKQQRSAPPSQGKRP